MIAVADADIAAGRIGVFDRDEIKHEVRDRLAKRLQGNVDKP